MQPRRLEDAKPHSHLKQATKTRKKIKVVWVVRSSAFVSQLRREKCNHEGSKTRRRSRRFRPCVDAVLARSRWRWPSQDPRRREKTQGTRELTELASRGPQRSSQRSPATGISDSRRNCVNTRAYRIKLEHARFVVPGAHAGCGSGGWYS